MRITQQDIARQLGIDRSTVSRALRHDPRIPASTRKQILAACRELDYRPSSVLSELAATRWRTNKTASTTVAYINCIRPGSPYWIETSSTLKHQASMLGYQVEVFSRADFSSSAKLQRVLRGRGITDVIIGPIHEKDFIVELDWKKFISIQLLPGFFPLRLHSVVRDYFSTVVQAWQKAVSYGYRRIGITLMDHSFRLMDDVMRVCAVDACQKQLFPHLPAIPPFHFAPPRGEERDFEKWVKTHQPDVILGFNAMHYVVFRSIFGYDIPFASLHLSRQPEPRLAGIIDNHDVLAIEGINLLHYCRRSYQWGIPSQRIDHVIEPTWQEGPSMPDKKLIPIPIPEG